MKIVIQRVSSSSIEVNQKVIAHSDKAGILALVGFGKSDDQSKLSQALEKLLNLRIFSNSDGRFDHSLIDIGGDLTLVPQFTLFADTSKGRRPEFFDAKNPKEANALFDQFVQIAKNRLGEERIQTGEFGADMKVSLLNDGPVTILLEI